MDESAGRNAPSMQVLIDNLPGNVYRRVRSPEGRYHFEFLSSGLFRHFDIDHRRLLAEHRIRFDWIHPDDRDRFVADLEMSAATLRLLDHRVRVVGEDGRIHWARGIARPHRRSDGSVVWDGIVIDVTREVEAEAALRVAKEEADRANVQAAAVVSDVTSRLAKPLAALRALLGAIDEAGALATEQRALASLCRARVEEAVEDLARTGTRSARPADLAASPPLPQAGLTLRQGDVLGLLRQGLSNKAIAARLGISPGTAKLHVAAVLRALGASNRRELCDTPRTARRRRP